MVVFRFLCWMLCLACLPLAVCFPSFRNHVPNGLRVACPPGGVGCRPGNTDIGEPGSICFGLGHATCHGGDVPLNPFGQAIREHRYAWTKELCEADSDDDGLTNGEELGDPCCVWAADDTPSVYTSTYAATHPGVKTEAFGYVRPACQDTVPLQKAVQMNSFNPGEEQRVVELFIDNYTLPTQRTVYVDFAWNFPDDTEDIFHAVYAEAIVRLKKNLHHFVITGCTEKFAADQHGKTISRSARRSCGVSFGGWAPGKHIISIPTFLGRPLGKKAKIVAFAVNVHYDNPDLEEGLVSNDGIRIFYTPTLRSETASALRTAQISVNPQMLIPAGKKRFFITRSCNLTVMNSGKTGKLHLSSMAYHAHLLGREMYAELTRGGTTINLGSEPIWHFDDQYERNLLPYNITVEDGDHLQTTCVYNSMDRQKATAMGKETIDEMCWASFVGWPGHVTAACTGHAWNGELADGESGLGLASRHPEADALMAWDMSDLLTGGRKVRAPVAACSDHPMLKDYCQQMVDGAASRRCDADLGQWRKQLAGLTLLSVCCTEVCAGHCKDHEDCPKDDTTTTPSSASHAASWQPSEVLSTAALLLHLGIAHM